jgi:hypothetical protein
VLEHFANTMIPSAAMPQDQVLAGTKDGFERPKMQIEYCCLSVTIYHSTTVTKARVTRKTKELDHEKLVTAILVPLSERHGE